MAVEMLSLSFRMLFAFANGAASPPSSSLGADATLHTLTPLTFLSSSRTRLLPDSLTWNEESPLAGDCRYGLESSVEKCAPCHCIAAICHVLQRCALGRNIGKPLGRVE